MAIARVEAFLASIHNKDMDTIKTLIASELDYLRKEYTVKDTPNSHGIYEGLASFKKTVTEYRKAIFSAYPDNEKELRELFNLSKLELNNFQSQNESAKYRFADKNKQITINNPDKMLNKAIDLLSNRSYVDNILGLALLTGRRVNEIALSNFELVDGIDIPDRYNHFNLTDLDFVYIDNLSKKERYDSDRETDTSAVIAVLSDSQIIINAIKELRQKKTFIDSKDFHNKASKELSLRCKKYFSEFLIGDKPQVKHLRSIYVRVLFDYFADMPESYYASFTKEVLIQNAPENYAKIAPIVFEK